MDFYAAEKEQGSVHQHTLRRGAARAVFFDLGRILSIC